MKDYKSSLEKRAADDKVITSDELKSLGFSFPKMLRLANAVVYKQFNDRVNLLLSMEKVQTRYYDQLILLPAEVLEGNSPKKVALYDSGTNHIALDETMELVSINTLSTIAPLQKSIFGKIKKGDLPIGGTIEVTCLLPKERFSFFIKVTEEPLDRDDPHFIMRDRFNCVGGVVYPNAKTLYLNVSSDGGFFYGVRGYNGERQVIERSIVACRSRFSYDVVSGDGKTHPKVSQYPF